MWDLKPTFRHMSHRSIKTFIAIKFVVRAGGRYFITESVSSTNYVMTVIKFSCIIDVTNKSKNCIRK